MSESTSKSELPAYAGPASQQPPPNIEDLSQRLNSLNLTQGLKPSPDQCIAHLKFLECLYQLREHVANTDGLFDIATPPEEKVQTAEGQKRNADIQIRVREKRWAVYVARAVDRFETWWRECIPATVAGAPMQRLNQDKYLAIADPDKVAVLGTPIASLNRDSLPPLDVLMVWHSYLLNPRCFLEDCIRYQKLDFYANYFPWDHIDKCIDNVTFDYIPTKKAQARWESATRRSWHQLHDPMVKTIYCPNSSDSLHPHETSFGWTECAGVMPDGQWSNGNGYADADFVARCHTCGIKITHDYLRVQKFRSDLIAWKNFKLPMAGTILGREGIPEKKKDRLSIQTFVPHCFVPNMIVSAPAMYETLIDVTRPESTDATLAAVRTWFESAIKDPKLLASGGVPRGRLSPAGRTAVRRMFSRYWYNASPFALDLVGAVVRQGSFIEKMHSIDWLHSPALRSTMERLITKYDRFFLIMAENPHRLAVPTLDVDLAWHTHQLAPQGYYASCMETMSNFVDHDDKIQENDLSQAFEWTSKIYARKYDEAYSQCTCWYCEAVRERNANVFTRMRKKDEVRRPEEGCPSDPMKSAHISAHNAVRKTDDPDAEARARVKAAELDKAYHKACARARKKGREPPPRDEYFYAYAYGYPFMYPMYYPYAVDPCIGYSGAYAAPPCDVNTASGSYGACAAGTCGGSAASGGCASAGGGCGSGGGCGGGGGGCGGGGGGGCGGGGGGGGCGGGGGGG